MRHLPSLPFRPIARVVLKHSTLKGVRSIPTVDQVPPPPHFPHPPLQNDFVKTVTRHPALMTVFDRQLSRFRELMLPSLTKGSLSFEASLQENSSYGSRSYR
jgi:hypothetical protein